MRAAILNPVGDLVVDIIEVDGEEGAGDFGAIVCEYDVNIGWSYASGVFSPPAAGSPGGVVSTAAPIPTSLLDVADEADIGMILRKVDNDPSDHLNDMWAGFAVTDFAVGLLGASTGPEVRDAISAAKSGANSDITALTTVVSLLMGSPAQTTRYAATNITPTLQRNGTTANDSSALISRWSASALGALLLLVKSRGPEVGAHAIVAAGDSGGLLSIAVDDGAQMIEIGRLQALVTGTPAAGSISGDIVILTNPGGVDTPSEAARFRANNDFWVGGGLVVDGNRTIIARSYTIATRPAASTGGIIYVSDLGGGGGLMGSNGTVWRRIGDGGTATVAADAAFTLTPLVSAPMIIHTGTLTANRTITLATTNVYDGMRFTIVRTGGGAFNLSIGGLKNLATGQKADVTYSADAGAFVLTAFGTL